VGLSRFGRTKMALSALAGLSPQTAWTIKCPVRVVFTSAKEVAPKTGKGFTMIRVYLVDESGDYTVAVRRLFGDEKPRRKLAGEVRGTFLDGSAWLLSHVTGAERTNSMYMCASVGFTITFGQARRHAKFTPILTTDPRERQLPRTIEPRACLLDLRDVVDKTVVNFMGILVSVEVPSGQPNHPVKVVIADGTGCIQVKCWGAHWAGQFADKEGQLLTGFNFLATAAAEDGSGGLRALSSVGASHPLWQPGGLCALSSVDASHLLWPTLDLLADNGRGRRLLAEKDAILAQTTPCLTGGNSETANYEEGEACATVAALMELANKYYEPLPDTLFQLQGAFVSIPHREKDYLVTKVWL
jgi:hypothetical protein